MQVTKDTTTIYTLQLTAAEIAELGDYLALVSKTAAKIHPDLAVRVREGERLAARIASLSDTRGAFVTARIASLSDADEDPDDDDEHPDDDDEHEDCDCHKQPQPLRRHLTQQGRMDVAEDDVSRCASCGSPPNECDCVGGYDDGDEGDDKPEEGYEVGGPKWKRSRPTQYRDGYVSISQAAKQLKISRSKIETARAKAIGTRCKRIRAQTNSKGWALVNIHDLRRNIEGASK